ncbi:DNA glycosylase [Sistotremastrum niveocremeum HHB9708]|uniref:DNA-(apurinic or apyrimidinic site) lyase n=2 Tax=Sistotremastraceae TaxID=3402574 RepID=A0A164S4N0_9AGAM|nr:DNA glycosylase [Sistotremastrum niveocremeum HHB9708]KZT40849.1 DNA glycosylase [Sistotremastrum suecicum HHB10207 ss-3]
MTSILAPPGFRSLSIPLSQLSLATVLKCGQSFRWHIFALPNETTDPQYPTHEYRLALHDRVICLQQAPDRLFYRSELSERVAERDFELRQEETLVWLRDYFQLDVDLLNLYDEWSHKDEVFKSLRHRFEGIRMLRQDPWENLISFICSSNNHISRISKMVQNLCTHFSSPTLSMASPSTPESTIYYPFPPPSALADPSVAEKLRSLGFGYRANFIQKTAQMLLEQTGSDQAAIKFLYELRSRPTDEAREELIKFMGVGRKVADCVLLMSIDKREVVPVDTHVHQIAVKHYKFRGSPTKTAMSPKLYDELQSKMSKIWGPWAGWAHSVLFTADLKSFSTYGLPTPSPSPEKPRPSRAVSDTQLLTTPTKNGKRKRKDEGAPSTFLQEAKTEILSEAIAELELKAPMSDVASEDLSMNSLAERVKRRKRTPLQRTQTR